MKRDDELIRNLLFEFESADDWLHTLPSGGVLAPKPEDRRKDYHVHLMADEGLVKAFGNSTFRLTSRGHDYLDAIRSDTIWKKTKDGASILGGATLGIMFDLAKAYIKQEAAEKLGLNL